MLWETSNLCTYKVTTNICFPGKTVMVLEGWHSTCIPRGIHVDQRASTCIPRGIHVECPGVGQAAVNNGQH